jgi:hypothetical protein
MRTASLSASGKLLADLARVKLGGQEAGKGLHYQ